MLHPKVFIILLVLALLNVIVVALVILGHK